MYICYLHKVMGAISSFMIIFYLHSFQEEEMGNKLMKHGGSVLQKQRLKLILSLKHRCLIV